ncbi:MAG: DUF192 domain-containing protein [Caulobacteraceae bacterium]|nr:DUF192 domain-containing protein [Caulobacteraceae bacterium]
MRFLARRALLAAFSAALMLGACALGDRSNAAASAEAGYISPLEDLTVVTSGGRHAFKVEIADDEAEREHGLMNRPSMPRDHGMLFEFQDNRERSFWMRNTYIPLDIIYIDRSGRIISIQANAVPFNETPLPSYGPATGVLEINGGLAAELGIREGDTVRHPFFGTR